MRRREFIAGARRGGGVASGGTRAAAGPDAPSAHATHRERSAIQVRLGTVPAKAAGVGLERRPQCADRCSGGVATLFSSVGFALTLLSLME